MLIFQDIFNPRQQLKLTGAGRLIEAQIGSEPEELVAQAVVKARVFDEIGKRACDDHAIFDRVILCEDGLRHIEERFVYSGRISGDVCDFVADLDQKIEVSGALTDWVDFDACFELVGLDFTLSKLTIGHFDAFATYVGFDGNGFADAFAFLFY